MKSRQKRMGILIVQNTKGYSLEGVTVTDLTVISEAVCYTFLNSLTSLGLDGCNSS